MSNPFQNLGSKVATDFLTRRLHATDASIYELVPQAVGFPKTDQDAVDMICTAAEHNVPITPRGAGTGLVGGAIGTGLVIDFARHNQKILHFDPDQKRVTVQPGVVLDQLNRFLRPHGLMFGPDVATSSRATLGGMIGNDSSGARVPRYGTTSHHLRGLKVITSNGEILRLPDENEKLTSQERFLNERLSPFPPELEDRKNSSLKKRWPGYALHTWDSSAPSWFQIFCGSEGTLVGFLEAELNLVSLPSQRRLGLVYFDDLAEAMQASVSLQALNPSAVEHIDRILLDQTRDQIAFRAARSFLQLDERPCESMLIVEFDHDVQDRLRELEQLKLGTRTQRAIEPHEMNLVWGLRKAGLSLLTGCKGSAKPTTGIEDAAIPLEKLPDYVHKLRALLNAKQLDACFYGHAASGLLHVRPVLDLQNQDDRRKFGELAHEVSQLVRELKGSLAAEHGVGMARAEFMQEQVGHETLELMRELKRTFDPSNLMNPGKVLGNADYRIDQFLRTLPRDDQALPFEPMLEYAAKDESFTRHLEQCNGCGGCKKSTPTMCPTFLATGEESMSTRGRANTIRALLTDQQIPGFDPLQSEALEHALSNCLACKACATECPSNVNLSLLKAELLHARQQQYGIPWQARIIGATDLLGRLGTSWAGPVNFFLKQTWVRKLLNASLGLTARRPLPPFTRLRFDYWFRNHPPMTAGDRGPVILWDDTFTRYYDSPIGLAAVKVLEAAGYNVELVQGRQCCGRPAFSQGLLQKAKHLGETNLSLLSSGNSTTPILFLEPSCYSMFIEDYRELGLKNAEAIARRCFLIEDYLFRDGPPLSTSPPLNERPIAVHRHCHNKALVGDSRDTRYLEFIAPSALQLDTGCCGMAGAFGALESKYDLSLQIAAPILKQLETLDDETIVLTTGTSCRQQLKHLTQKTIQHPIELIASTYGIK
jgi:FAD/FMN-containing dehydrogenase/Fe-S oxidoreductase